jgi:CubicO group peptidase (beta-lactamase class C family)
MRRLAVLCCLCAALLTDLACTGEKANTAQEAPRLTASEAKAIAGVEALLRELTAADRFSGAVQVAKDGQVLFSKAYGLADREKGIPNTLQTRFRIGSMNKMFTAVAILQLVEAGKVELTAPVGKYLPDYPNRDVATKVAIHHLLTHTGGPAPSSARASRPIARSFARSLITWSCTASEHLSLSRAAAGRTATSAWCCLES